MWLAMYMIGLKICSEAGLGLVREIKRVRWFKDWKINKRTCLKQGKNTFRPHSHYGPYYFYFGGSKLKIVMDMVCARLRASGSIPSFLIKFSLWTSTYQAAMQHYIEQTIPQPILISGPKYFLAFSDLSNNFDAKLI